MLVVGVSACHLGRFAHSASSSENDSNTGKQEKERMVSRRFGSELNLSENDEDLMIRSKANVDTCICASPLLIGYVNSQGGLYLRAPESMIPEFDKVKLRIIFRLIGSGSDHVVAVAQDGQIITWGSNKHGQLGRQTNDQDTNLPGRIDLFGLKNITQLACGDSHSLVSCEGGKVYSWGRSDYGQLGWEGGYKEPFSIGLVEGIPTNKEVQSVAAGALHSACIVDYELYTFGWGLYGQLGHGEVGNERKARKVEALTGVGMILEGGRKFQSVKQVACGTWHTFVVSTTGDLYGFGWNKFGQIVSESPSESEQFFLPKLVHLSDNEVKHVSCGSRHTAVSFANSEICLFGNICCFNNDGYCLEMDVDGDDYRKNQVAYGQFSNYPPTFLIWKSKANVTPNGYSRIHCRHHFSNRWCTVIST